MGSSRRDKRRPVSRGGSLVFRQVAQREGLDLEIDTDNLFAAGLIPEPGTLTELGETQVSGLAQFQSRGDKDAVDLKT